MTMTNAGLREATLLTGNGLGGTKFDAMAIGTSDTAPAAAQTALLAEITTGGGARKSLPDVTGTLEDAGGETEDTLQWVATWAFTNSFSVNELGVFNDPSAGVMLLRQVFADPLNVVSQDALELTVQVVVTDETVSALSVLTHAGIAHGNALILGDDAESARLVAIALGESAAGLDQDNTALGDEIVAADGVGLGRGQETSGPTVTLETENVTDDTVVVTSTWAVTGTITVNETGSFTSTSPSSGTLFVRYVFADPLNLINTDTFTMIMRLVQVA